MLQIPPSCLNQRYLQEENRDHRAQLFSLSSLWNYNSVLHVTHCLKIITLYIFPSFKEKSSSKYYITNRNLGYF